MMKIHRQQTLFLSIQDSNILSTPDKQY